MFVGIGNAITILGRRFTVSGGGVIPPVLDTLPTDLSGLLAWHSVASDSDMALSTGERADFSLWTPTAATVTGSVADPFGGTGAYNLVEDTAAGVAHGATRSSPSFSTGDNEVDMYIKPLGSTKRWVAINIGTTTSALTVDPTTGEYTQGSNCTTVTVTAAGNGWYRVQAIFSRSSGTDSRIYLTTALSQTAASYTGTNAGVSLYIANWRRRAVSQVNDKSGNGYHMTQATDASRPVLLDNPLLTSGSNRVIASHVSSITKTLSDHNGVWQALTGSDRPFTVAWLGRYAGFPSGETDTWVLSGSTARHRVLSATGSYAFIQQRTDDAAATKFANSSSLDFTPDTNWHATAIVFSGTGSQLWIDGQKSTSTFDLNVGTSTFDQSFETFTARMWRERAIYSRALSDTEVVNLQNGMRARAGLPTFSLENPLNVPGVQAWFESDMVQLSTASIPADLSNTAVWALTKTSSSLNADGSTRVYEDSGASGAHYISANVVNGAAGTMYVCADLKTVSGSRGFAMLGPNANATQAFVDLVSGTISSTTAVNSSSIRALELAADGNRWYRVEADFTYSTAATRIYTVQTNGSTTTYAGDGRANFDVRNVQMVQLRVSSMMNKGPAAWSLDQATVASQPFYFSGSYGAMSTTSGSLINGRPTVGENLNAAAESLASNAAFSGIWSGNDRPISLVALVDRTANPGGTTNMMQWTGSPAVHQMMRLGATGLYEGRRLDNASTTTNVNYATIPTGTYTISQIFTGQSESLYRDGTQVGSTINLDVGETTLGASLNFQPRATAFYGFCMANRELTSAERQGLETGFRKRAGLA
jgi:hypothetical protein